MEEVPAGIQAFEKALEVNPQDAGLALKIGQALVGLQGGYRVQRGSPSPCGFSLRCGYWVQCGSSF